MTVQDLAVFDFDWSLIEADSDATVCKHFCPNKWASLPPSAQRMQWTDLIDQTLCEIQDGGSSIDDIEKVLQRVPMVPSALELLESLRASNTRVLILSDANTFFIDVILRAHGVRDLVSDIITNPAYTDDQGRLRINRRILSTEAPHNCPNTCTVNICKGQELDRYIATHGPFRRIMYVGDGMNDYCPGLRLKHTDLYFVRNGKQLARALTTKPEVAGRLLVQVTYWKDHAVIVETVAKPAAVPSL
ncbi:phosphatase phospho-type [Zychaea mexicana]|uniref:phosphatase phospho-type n=1 Tax=Zychaea mexicana TaxID=64656 RepID=UPI0022FE4BCF|nr:phosphatase phospho-type [Zychaea mexicana]KAI9497808.1 phosphatase phospho-type [Zychaea mexicana]